MNCWTSCAVSLFLISCPAVATPGVQTLFASDALLDITIAAPFKAIMRNRDVNEESDAELRYRDLDGRTVVIPIRLRPRGQFRRRPDICQFAPLRLNFRKSQVTGTLFAGQDKLKLVTHCNDNRQSEQSVLREYLAYRVLNSITEVSFRARLLRLAYVDTGRDNRTSIHFGILLEHADSLAKRVGVSGIELRSPSTSLLDASYTNLISVFQYFIGNADFSFVNPEPDSSCCHNQALFLHSGGRYYSVPYDFDMSGFVKAPHNKPEGATRQVNTRQRRYHGLCENNEHLLHSVERFVRHREEIVGLINDLEVQKKVARRRLLRFVDKFYEAVDTPESIEKKLVRSCKQSGS